MQPTVLQITTNPGTPVQVSTDRFKCAAIWVTNLSTQIVAFGNKDLNRATGAGVIAYVPALAAGATPDTAIIKLGYDAMSEDPYDLRDFYVDSSTAAVINVIPFIL